MVWQGLESWFQFSPHSLCLLLTATSSPVQVPSSVRQVAGFAALETLVTLAALLVTAECFFWEHFEACGIHKQGVGEWADALTVMWTWVASWAA